MRPPIEIRLGAARPSLARLRESGRISLHVPDLLLKDDGRTMIWRESLEGGERAVLKAYIRRRPWTQRFAFFFRFCVQREYETLLELEEAGVPCTVPLLWGRGRSPAIGRFQILATREIPGARSLRECYLNTGAAVPPDILSALSGHVRQMHRRGIYHGALSWKNVLVSGPLDQRPGIHLADLARSIRFSRDIRGSRMAWIDLLHFCYHLLRFCDPPLEAQVKESCRRFVLEYGLDERSAAAFLDALPRYQPEPKMPRRIRRIEFLSRSFLSRLRPGAARRDEGSIHSCGTG